MDSNALKAFLTIVDQGSFSEAAEILHLTQPAISKRLAALENQLGTSLTPAWLNLGTNRLVPTCTRLAGTN